MSEESFQELPLPQIRQRMETRKRVTLTEGRILLDRLEAAIAENNRLQASSGQPEPADQTTPPDDQHVPPALQALLAETRHSAAVQDTDSIAGAVYAWCQHWLEVRSALLALYQTEQQLVLDMQRLQQEASELSQRLAASSEQHEA